MKCLRLMMISLLLSACDSGASSTDAGTDGGTDGGDVSDLDATVDGSLDSETDAQDSDAESDAGDVPLDARVPDPDALSPDAAVPEEVVSVDFDDLQPLDPPLSGEETLALREGFDWGTADAWPEENANGDPALFYAMIYVSSEAEVARLDALGIHHWQLPLFVEEREQWAGQRGVLSTIGDGVGSFEFVIISGGMFNAMGRAATDGDEPFPAVVRREAPAGVTGADGSLDYEALFLRGFTFNPNDPDAIPGAIPGAQVEKDTLFAAVAIVAREAEDAWNDNAAAFENEFRNDKIDVAMRLDLRNTDPSFGVGTRMVRGWSSTRPGQGRGDRLLLPGIQFVIGAGVGHLRRNADEDGIARFHIGRNTSYDICVRVANHAAKISELWVSKQICEFGGARLELSPDVPRLYEFIVQDWHLNVLAQMTDAFAFSREKLGHRPTRQARVLVGTLADLFGEFNNNRAFALCGGYGLTAQNLEFAALAGVVAAQLALLPLPPDWIALAQLGVIELARTALSFDIIFPGAGAGATLNRGVATHEYGHYLTCDLLYRHANFSTAWAAVVNLAVTVGQTPDTDSLYLVEATAEFIASQVVGGVNYFDPSGARVSGDMTYCQPGSSCLEDNIGGDDAEFMTGDGFERGLATMTSIFYDLFDGGIGIEQRVAWTHDGTQLVSAAPAGLANTNDEQIALDLTDFVTFFREIPAFRLLYDRRTFVIAWTRVLRRRGYSENQICELFALHSVGGDCLEWLGGALDTGEVQPTTPLLVSHIVIDSTGIRWAWRDISLLARAFEIEWGVSGQPLTLDEVPWARAADYTVEDLEFDTDYVFRLRTTNGGLFSRWVEVHDVTGAEPVDAVRLTSALPGGAELSWDETQASRYRVEFTPVLSCVDDDRLCVASACEGGACFGAPQQRTVEAARVVLRGLTPGGSYVARVFAENSTGVPAAQSPDLVFETGEVETLWVDPVGGNDGNTGEEALPMATLDAALLRARRGADVIRVTGQHTVNGGVQVPADVAIDGGWRRVGGVWRADPGARAQLTINGATRTASGCHGASNDAAIVGLGDALVLSNLDVIAALGANAAGVCRVGVASEGDELLLTNVRVSMSANSPAPASVCAVAVDAVGGSVRIVDSVLTGSPRVATRPYASGICVRGADDVSVERSRITGVGDLRNGDDVVHAVGAELDAATISIARSWIGAGPAGAPAVGQGQLDGLLARAGGAIRITNTVIRTPPGGDDNTALGLDSRPGGLPLVQLGFTTVVNGDGALPVVGALDHAGTVVRFPEQVGTLRIMNSVLVLGSARRGALTVMDRTRGNNPGTLDLVGTVASINKAVAQSALYVRCPAGGEFNTLSQVGEFEVASNHVCPVAGNGAGWAFERVYALDGSAARPAAWVNSLGQIRQVGAGVYDRVAALGAGFGSLAPIAADFATDINQAPRRMDNPGVGALAPGACVAVDWFVDSDDDGYGTGLVNRCAVLPDWVAVGGDCNDRNRAISPAAREVCDGVDNNCMNGVDEGVANACGGCGPVPPELCDGRDNNCNGQIDELAGIDESGGGRIDVDMSTRQTLNFNNRINSTVDTDLYRVDADEARSAQFGCEGGCATANEQTQFTATLTTPADAGGPFELCVGNGNGPDGAADCVVVQPGVRADASVAMAGRNCCNGILCDQDNSATFFAIVRGQGRCSNSTYALSLRTFEVCVP